MHFSREKFDDIQRAIRLALVSTALKDAERKFLRDMQAKLDQYGSRTFLSDKEFRHLMKLTGKYGEPKQQNAHGSRRPNGHGFGQRRRRGWQPAIGLAIIAITLGLVFMYIGAERFPEYFGPVVAISSGQEIVGRVTHVRDGDTIEVSGIPIRFGSLDCAESGTSAGERATARMRTLVAGQILTCYLNGRTSYDRKIGSCRLQDGRDLGAIMIRGGYCGRFW
ncbi:thermonuclease family protein [Zhengella sp. ZM62]|uniref:thermonuclease family protein n=1 Tax=Zhengella sedimenti TaxID=3390035 RepID=UPI003975B7FB